METEFKIRGEYIELIKLLKVAGFCESGGEAKRVVEENQVRVDGQIETRKKRKIKAGQIVEFEGQRLSVI